LSVEQLGAQAAEASRVLMTAGSEQKNNGLEAIAKAIEDNQAFIIEENQKDLEAGRQNGLTESLLDRLMLNEGRLADICGAVRSIAGQADPVGEILSGSVRPNGLQIQKVRVPLGVVGIIYEARPNVTVDAAALCLKSGNTCILRGGKEAIRSNTALVQIMRKAVTQAGLPENTICLIEDTSRESAKELMRLNKYVSVLIPRGGAGLIRSVVENATVPVIETGVGNCHVYVEESADIDMAKNIIYNAKTSRVSVCNAIETMLIHKNIAQRALPIIKEALDQKDVEIRGCAGTASIIPVTPATDEDYATEFSDYIIACRIVDSTEEAVEHIAKYGSGHSDCIVTESYAESLYFTSRVDAAAVYVNASTRFTDGGEFGLGAEVGISTQKLHARGPMGITALTSEKYIILGTGQCR